MGKVELENVKIEAENFGSIKNYDSVSMKDTDMKLKKTGPIITRSNKRPTNQPLYLKIAIGVTVSVIAAIIIYFLGLN